MGGCINQTGGKKAKMNKEAPKKPTHKDALNTSL